MTGWAVANSTVRTDVSDSSNAWQLALMRLSSVAFVLVLVGCAPPDPDSARIYAPANDASSIRLALNGLTTASRFEHVTAGTFSADLGHALKLERDEARVRELKGEHDAVLEFEVEIDGISVNGVDMIKWNDAGKITEFKVMLRPLKAVNLIHEKMGAMLQAASSLS